jgi:hypothetical protein
VISVTLHRFEGHTDRRCDPVLHAAWRQLPACHFVYTAVLNQPFCGVPEHGHRCWQDAPPADAPEGAGEGAS